MAASSTGTAGTRGGRRPKVFGIGLSRTGTTSLNSALELLGLRSIHFPADARTRRQVLRHLAGDRRRLRLSILRRADALTDTPVCATFEALDAAYPGSRFVLTMRAKEPWLESCERYWEAGLDRFLREHPDDPYAVYVGTIGRALYGSERFDRDRFAHAYDAYGDRVARHFAGRERDLLRLDLFAGEGWAELCAFLDRPAPEVAFPADNPDPRRPAPPHC